jgi:hypothetical protein
MSSFELQSGFFMPFSRAWIQSTCTVDQGAGETHGTCLSLYELYQKTQ